MGGRLRSITILTKLQRIAEQAVQQPEWIFTNLAHHMDVDFLREAYRRTRKDAAPGIDGVTAKEYAENLEESLNTLYERMRGGRYKAPPVKRVWLEKEDGSKRPIGMPEFEDKIVQRAVSMLLGAIYEEDFYDFSHGFREKHSPHQALQELREQCMKMNINWIVDADVSGFFDNLDHGILREVIRKRVNDGTIIRFIGKWLNAGVVDGGSLVYPEKGTPQGGVISPMLANIFLHHVLDEWYVREVKSKLRGKSFLIRFADDFIIGCERKEDALELMEELPKRFESFNLNIHPEKTALIEFSKPSRKDESAKGRGTFNFLGFTHYWAKSRRGNWVIKRRTMKERIMRAKRALWQWCRKSRHWSAEEQHRKLAEKLRGHYEYYGIRCNYEKLREIYRQAKRAWRYWLSRRSHKSHINWDKFENTFLKKWPLPKPKIVHCI